MLDAERCWKSVLEKDRTQDGNFVFAVRTTGVYCRPSCPARTPLRKNVLFYSNRAEAEREGFRPCKRCRPTSISEAVTNKIRIRRLCAYIRDNCQSGRAITLNELAQQVQLSPFHLQRTFKAITGLTPKQYIETYRVEALKEQLRRKESVASAIYEAGFGSSRGVYERSDSRMGMTPSQYRTGGQGLEISYVSVESPLGLLMLGATERGLCFLQFGESHDELLARLRKEFPRASLIAMAKPYPEQFEAWMKELFRYLRREQIRLDLPVDISGSAFQQKVWRFLQSIPPGEVRSYAAVAKAIGSPQAFRAVANACASNRIAILVPCHRVIRGDGGLGGYRWGLERKSTLLEAESQLAATPTRQRA